MTYIRENFEEKPIINNLKQSVVKIDSGDFSVNRVETRDGVRARQHDNCWE